MGSVLVAGKDVYLTQVEDGSDCNTLYKWRNQESFISNCCSSRSEVEYEEFVVELNDDFKKDRFLQVIAKKRDTDRPIGTLYAYHFDEIGRHVFVTTYIEDEFQNIGLGVKSFALFVDYLFNAQNLFKIYCDVYANNSHSIGLLKRFSTLEGEFKGHKLINGSRISLLRYAIYRNDVRNMKKLVDRVKGAE